MHKPTQLFLATLLFSFTSMAFAFGPGQSLGGSGKGGDMKFVIFEQALELTDEQSQQIQEIRRTHKAQMRAQKAARLDQQPDFDPLAADYDQQVAAFAEQRAQAVKTKVTARAQMFAEIYQILTPEQQQKALSMQRAMRENMNTRRQKKQRD